MDQETDRIKQHIDNERDRLGEDLQEIENRMKNATDWKAWFAGHSGFMLGTVVAWWFHLVTGRRASPLRRTPAEIMSPDSGREKRPFLGSIGSISSPMHRISETLDNTFEALVGVVSGKFQDFIADTVPGFREQYDKIDKKKA